MCGIAGFLGNFDPSLLGVMNRTLAHRGPDGEGVWHDPAMRVGLTHRRLAIIDLSGRGLQPMWDATRRVVITFNGEIYNYRELRRELESDGFQFASDSDTEVILNLYLRDGPTFLSRLNGIFAFGLWDTRKKELLLARDGLGVKPLYYAHTSAGILFASELKALLATKCVDRTLDIDAVGCYLTYLYAPGAQTMLKSVRKLGAGRYLRISWSGEVQEKVYYELPYHQPISAMTADEAVAQTRHYLQQAVRRQMVSDVPVGAFLSGGLDSSSVAAFAQQSMGSRALSCFTIGFEGMPPDAEGMVADLPYAQRVAAHLGVDLKTIYVNPSSGVDLEQMVYQLDEPEADPAALNTYYISKLARENGIKVLLSGAGGDDIFTGYRRHQAMELEKYWTWMPQTARYFLRSLGSLLSKESATGRRFTKAFQYAHLSGDQRIVSYFQWITPEVQRTLFAGQVGRYMHVAESSRVMLEALRRLPPDVAPLNRMLYLDTKYFLTDHNLNYTDKMGMAAGVEIRVPLLDYDLVDFAARLPTGFKQRGATGKWIFRQAMEPYLPQDVIYRPKTGFGVPLRTWLHGRLGETVADYLTPEAINRRGLFDAAGVQKLIQNDRAGRVDAAYSILALACVEIWMRKFID
ncbi:MAG: asparagine synthase (glutamine-hydrolyzing) [Candidatus Didemnitutus sp.]|nr:asparagine synthase (glutamine-hydrolyzing) [Candidatus Didemnitutus sp.]